MAEIQRLSEQRVADATGLRDRIVKGFQYRHECDMKLRTLILEFDEQRGWEALGHSSLWGSLEGPLRAKLGLSARQLLDYRDQAMAARQVGLLEGSTAARRSGKTTGKSGLGHVSGRVLQQLAKLNEEPAQQREVYKRAKRLAGVSTLTGRMVRKAMKAVAPNALKLKKTVNEAQALARAISRIGESADLLNVAGAPKKNVLELYRVIGELNEWRTKHVGATES